MPADYIYSGSDDNELHKIDSNGNNIWKYTEHTNDIHGVVVDADGYVYSGSADGEVHKIDSNGNNIWKYTEHSGNIQGVAVDADGNVYSAGALDAEVHKIDSSGANVWKYTDHTSSVYAVAVDADGYVYSGSYEDEVHKTDPAGNNIWIYTGHSGTVAGVAVDADGYVYSGSSDDEVHKIDSSGANVWKYTGHTHVVRDVAVDVDGYVYSGSSDDEVHKIDSSGANVWKYTGHPYPVTGVAVDVDGYVYSGSYEELRKIDPDGNNIWTYTEHTAYVVDVSVLSYPVAFPIIEVSTYDPSNITSNSATLSGSIVDMAENPSLSASFEWGPTDSYGYTTPIQILTSIGNFDEDISNLNFGTTYHYRSIVTDGSAEEYGSDITFVATDFTYEEDSGTDFQTGELTGVETTSETLVLSSTVIDEEGFETDLGDWINTGNRDWVRNSGSTGSSSTGPSEAYEGTYYVYFETSSGSSSWEVILEYQSFVSKISFAYHMYGSTMGSLYLEGYDGSSWVEIWSKTGDQGNQWFVEEIYCGYEKVRFRGTYGGSYRGDMALDAISIFEPNSSGYRVTPEIDLSSIDSISDSLVQWESIEPEGTLLTIESRYSTDAGSTWSEYQECTSGSPVPILPSNANRIQFTQTLSASSGAPELESFALYLDGEESISEEVTEHYDTSWSILSGYFVDTSWGIYDENVVDVSWRIATTANPTEWKILDDKIVENSWKILSGYFVDTSWGTYDENVVDVSWGTVSEEPVDISWKILDDEVIDTTWSIYDENVVDVSWILFNQNITDIYWKIKSENSIDVRWDISATSVDISWNILRYNDINTTSKILNSVVSNASWKILFIDSINVSWEFIKRPGKIWPFFVKHVTHVDDRTTSGETDPQTGCIGYASPFTVTVFETPTENTAENNYLDLRVYKYNVDIDTEEENYELRKYIPIETYDVIRSFNVSTGYIEGDEFYTVGLGTTSHSVQIINVEITDYEGEVVLDYTGSLWDLPNIITEDFNVCKFKEYDIILFDESWTGNWFTYPWDVNITETYGWSEADYSFSGQNFNFGCEVYEYGTYEVPASITLTLDNLEIPVDTEKYIYLLIRFDTFFTIGGGRLEINIDNYKILFKESNLGGYVYDVYDNWTKIGTWPFSSAEYLSINISNVSQIETIEVTAMASYQEYKVAGAIDYIKIVESESDPEPPPEPPAGTD